METIDISGKIKNLIRFGLILLLGTAGAIGYGVFEHYHAAKELRIEDAKITGTMVSVRTLVNGQVGEFLVDDGAEVKAGDVIAKIKVSVTEEDIQQLQDTLDMARANYEELQKGKWVTVPVKRMRAVRTPVTSTITHRGTYTNNSANLASLQERANRMRELYAMGAVSAQQRDAAIQAYETAKRNQGSSYSPYTTTDTTYETTYVEEIEYVEQFQPTPPEILSIAENAVKQAELSLNVAQQQALQTEIVAPVDGTLYYSAEVDKDLNAGDVVAKVGDSNELWLAAEVSEETFNKVSLGKLVNYSIDGKNLTGIVIEKIAPDPVEEIVEEEEPVWQPPKEENSVAENSASEVNSSTEKSAGENSTDAPPRNDKFILRVSLPTESDLNYKPNSTTTLKVKL
ncbi:MAG: biotin/lipoyl-binding protein [Selenomonadaceae bacterium]|nr:biotin/lipoyl-binding protein [Selenomonadaceae bacterium]